MKFTVSDIKTSNNSQKKIKYDETEWYYTKNIETSAEGWENERNITKKYSEIVPSEYFNDWIDAVMEYINKCNSKLPKGVTYEILDKRGDGQYKYKIKSGGNVIEEGVQDYFDVPEDNIDAWDTAVIQFHRSNNIPLPSDELKENINTANNKAEPGKTLFEGGPSSSTPSLTDALGMIKDNPKEFPSTLMAAVKKGPKGPKDNVLESHISETNKSDDEMSKTADDPATVLKPTTKPVLNVTEDEIKEVETVDTSQEAFRKRHPNEVNDIELLLAEDLDDIEDEDIVIKLKESKYEIPVWFMENINKAMTGRYGKDGEPSEDIINRYEDNKKDFAKIFKKYKVPEELTLISIIETECKNIEKENNATALGMWQIIRTTGAQYGLLEIQLKPGISKSSSCKDYNIISDYDKRTDILASTEAIAKILKDIRKAQNGINKWILVAAAYNCGEGNMSIAIKKAGNNANIWDIWEALPSETKTYVCLLFGLCLYFDLNTDILFE